MTTSAMTPTTNSDQLLALAQSGHSLAALRLAILESAIATRTGQPVTSPDYV